MKGIVNKNARRTIILVTLGLHGALDGSQYIRALRILKPKICPSRSSRTLAANMLCTGAMYEEGWDQTVYLVI